MVGRAMPADHFADLSRGHPEPAMQHVLRGAPAVRGQKFRSAIYRSIDLPRSAPPASNLCPAAGFGMTRSGVWRSQSGMMRCAFAPGEETNSHSTPTTAWGSGQLLTPVKGRANLS